MIIPPLPSHLNPGHQSASPAYRSPLKHVSLPAALFFSPPSLVGLRGPRLGSRRPGSNRWGWMERRAGERHWENTESQRDRGKDGACSFVKKGREWNLSREGEAQRLRPAWPRPTATVTYYCPVRGAREGGAAEGRGRVRALVGRGTRQNRPLLQSFMEQIKTVNRTPFIEKMYSIEISLLLTWLYRGQPFIIFSSVFPWKWQLSKNNTLLTSFLDHYVPLYHRGIHFKWL